MPIKQSVCIPILPQDAMPRDQLLAEIASIGYPAIEIWGWDDDLPGLCEAAAGNGLRMVSMRRPRLSSGRPQQSGKPRPHRSRATRFS